MKHRLLKGMAGAFIVMAALLPVAAMAAEFRGDRSGTTSINEAVNNDLYSAGGSVSLNAPVSGDGTFVGGNVLLSGSVGGSVLAGGGTVTVLGKVENSVRVVGGNVFINGSVGRDVIALGGQINVSSSASVGRDLVILGGAVTIDGPVNGDVYVRGGNVTINAPIKGSVNASARTAIVFGPQAAIEGKLMYSSPSETSIANGVVKGGVEYKKFVNKESAKAGGVFVAFFTLALLIKLVSLFVLALILTAVFKKRSAALLQNAYTGFGWNILHGFSALVLVPVAALLLLITVIGAPLAGIAICAYGILLALSGILAPIMVGGWIWKFIKKSNEYPVNVYTILVGTLVYVFAAFVPIIGWAFCLVFFLAAGGVLTGAIMGGITAAQTKK